MKVRNWLGTAAALALLVSPLAAHGGHKCDKDTQACLNEMAAHMKDKGWAGLELDKSDPAGMTVTRVHAGSPAEAAGFRTGDVIVALNGIRLGAEKNKEALYAVKKTLKPGSQATYTVARGGKEKDVTVTLVKPPEEVIASWIGSHMMEHAQVAVAKN
jgi:S1-C subfamily serine protease